MSIHYPLYLLSKDCAEVERYQSFEDLQGYIEPIDVENREFFCWDDSETVFSLKVNENEKNWLNIAPADPSEILGIDCHYASWEWFNEYLEGGIKNNSIDNQLCAPDFPKNLFFSKRASLITLP